MDFVNEKWSAAYELEGWHDFLLQISPDTVREDVYSSFRPLYKEDMDKGFKFAMMFGNLRPGSLFSFWFPI